jgi:hypothetical protein
VLREAELFVMAQDVLVEVVGRIRPEHRHIIVPPQFDPPADDSPVPLPVLVERLARDDARLPDLLAGRDPGDVTASASDHPRLADAARAAALKADDPDAVVPGDGDVRTFLLRAALWRTFSAHDIAMHLGSRACPLTEEQARGLWEITQPAAARWREQGVFRAPLEPLPADVSWRDRFLMSAGRDPHALDH